MYLISFISNVPFTRYQSLFSGFVVGNYAKVLAGPHEDLYGKVILVCVMLSVQ